MTNEEIRNRLEQAVEARKNQLNQIKEHKEACKQRERTAVANLVNDFLAENLPRVIELGLGSLELELEHKDITNDLVDALEPYASSVGEPKGFIKDYVPEVYHPYLKGTWVIIQRYSTPFRKKIKEDVSIVFYTVTEL